jgi:putative ABC transport system substrate-binding protein
LASDHRKKKLSGSLPFRQALNEAGYVDGRNVRFEYRSAESLAQQGADVLCVEADWFLNNQAERLVALSARHALPTIYSAREPLVAGSLMSYGTDRADAYRIMGTYAARMLKGEKPVDVPVQQSTQVRLAINFKTAKSFGLSFPVTLLGRADEVIE